MWTCPKCGRAFQETGQSHYCGEKPRTIDDYILHQDEDKQADLRCIRQILRRALPNAEERISWSMPTYWRGRNLIQFAGFKRHIGLYPGPQAVEAFADRLSGYKASKGAIQLPLDRPMPVELIAEIAAWCGGDP